MKTSESFSRTEGDNDFLIPETSHTAIQLKPENSENDLLPEVNNDYAQHYPQRLRTSVRPPNRYGFKDGQYRLSLDCHIGDIVKDMSY